MVEIEAGKLILGVSVLIIAGLYLSQNPEAITWMFQGGEEVGQEVGQEVSQDALDASQFVTETETEDTTVTTTIVAIESVTLELSFPDALNETPSLVTPTVYTWKPGQVEPSTATVTSGVASISLAPKTTVTYAAGSSSYYYEKNSVTVGIGRTAHQQRLYAIPGATGATIQVFDTSYTELSAGASNKTLGSGEDTNLQVKIDVTQEYRAVKRPHVCVAYNDTICGGIKLTGLKEVDAPTRLISALDQCFDTAMTYFTYADPSKLYDTSWDTITGQDPYAAGSRTYWYLIDKDIWFKDGIEYFVNPIDRSDMGSTTAWSTDTFFA